MKLAPVAALVFGLALPSWAGAELSDTPLLGLGLRTRPAYDGSASQHGEVVPVIRWLGQPLFVRSTQGVLEGGLRVELATGLHAGAQLAYEPGRAASESAFLVSHAINAVDKGASVGAQLEWDQQLGPAPVTLLVRGRRHVDAARGAQADLRLSVGVFKAGPASAGVFTQAVWASAKSAAAMYEVTPLQSATSGLPAFKPGGGWMSASFGGLWSVDLGRDWVAVGNLEWRRLQGDASRSPLVERAWNHAASAGLAHRF